jgi:hypothetical protein
MGDEYLYRMGTWMGLQIDESRNLIYDKRGAAQQHMFLLLPSYHWQRKGWSKLT